MKNIKEGQGNVNSNWIQHFDTKTQEKLKLS